VPLRAQAFERLHDDAKIAHTGAPVQQVEVQIAGCQACEACHAGGPHSVGRGVRGPHLGDHEYLATLTRDDAPDHLLGVSISVNLGRVEEGHAERYARARLVAGMASTEALECCPGFWESRHHLRAGGA
jgi:hypothetical protein